MSRLNSHAADGWKDEHGRLRVIINGHAVLMEAPPTNGNGNGNGMHHHHHDGLRRDNTVLPLDDKALAW